LLPVYLLEAPGPQGNAVLPYRIEPEVDLSEGPHMGYALQWFAFAIVAGVVYVAAVHSRLRKAHTADEQANGSALAASGAASAADAASNHAHV
jgi:surfeit locus 1 family protein